MIQNKISEIENEDMQNEMADERLLVLNIIENTSSVIREGSIAMNNGEASSLSVKFTSALFSNSNRTISKCLKNNGVVIKVL